MMKHVGCAVKESLKLLIGNRDASVVTDTGGKTTAGRTFGPVQANVKYGKME